ncbi:MAG: hypothetical protein ABIG89_05230 [Candidatus Woesearchaeota archaeon]
MKQLIPIGIFLLFLGIIFIFVGALSNANKTDTKVAVGGFIGFIPFGFANDKRLMWIVMGLMGSMVILLFFLQLRFK